MKTSSKIALFAAVILLLLGGMLWFFGNNADPPTPEQRIVQTLHDAEVAAKRGSVNGVMDTISSNFQAGIWDYRRLKLYLIRTLSQGRGANYDVHLNQPLIQPLKGRKDERLVTTRFAAFDSGTGADIYKTNEPLILVMREESRTHWLIFREPYWRVVGVANLPVLPGSDGGTDSGGGLF